MSIVTEKIDGLLNEVKQMESLKWQEKIGKIEGILMKEKWLKQKGTVSSDASTSTYTGEFIDFQNKKHIVKIVIQSKTK